MEYFPKKIGEKKLRLSSAKNKPSLTLYKKNFRLTSTKNKPSLTLYKIFSPIFENI